MECRICNQHISFVRGNYPGHKRRAIRAVHDDEVQKAMEQANGEVVTPHPGVQRKLRLELEQNHPKGQANVQSSVQTTPGETQGVGTEEGSPDYTDNTQAYRNASA